MRPSMFNRVDLPHPEGPMIARNSPWPTSRLRSSSAAVSTSSARKILETCSSFSIDAPSVCQDNAIGLFQCRVIGSNHLFADSQSAQDFQLLHGAAADLDTSALGETAPRSHDKHPVTTGTFQERTHRKDFRLRVVAQLQVTQQRLSGDQVGRAATANIQIHPEMAVMDLWVNAMDRYGHCLAMEFDIRAQAEAHACQVELVDVG